MKPRNKPLNPKPKPCKIYGQGASHVAAADAGSCSAGTVIGFRVYGYCFCKLYLNLSQSIFFQVFILNPDSNHSVYSCPTKDGCWWVKVGREAISSASL